MMGVVMNHVFNYGLRIYDDFTVDVSTSSGFVLWSVLELMKLAALPSVNCYILITGFFLIDRTTLRMKGMWKVWSVTWFYSVGIYLLAVALSIAPFHCKELLEHATPVLSNSFWFVTSYLVLIAVAPAVAWLMLRVSKRQYQIVLIVGTMVCFQPFLGHFLMDSQQILLFIFLFLIGGYIRRFHEKESSRNRYALLGCLAILLLMYAYSLFKNISLGNSQYIVYAMAYHGLVLPFSVVLFLLFKDMHISSKFFGKVIFMIAPLSFAVYIIHTQSVVHHFLWDAVNSLLMTANRYAIPVVCIAVTFVVFVAGIAIDYIRTVIIKSLSELCRRNVSQD